MDNLRTDCMLSEILEERKSLIGFLDAVFGFLSRKTDFYHIQKAKDEKVGFPLGIKEQILLSSMQKFDKYQEEMSSNPAAMCYENLPPPAVEEVEIESIDDNVIADSLADKLSIDIMDAQSLPLPAKERKNTTRGFSENEYKNGAFYDKYCWSQTLKDVEVSVLLPQEVKTGRHLKLNLKSTHVSIKCFVPNETELLSGDTWDRYKANDVVWTISDGKLLLSFDKSKECWWDKLFNQEPSIDIKKLETERHISEYSEETQKAVEKIETENLNSEGKQEDLKTLPMSKSEQLSRLRQAWNADDSPFKGQTFDPSMLQFY